MTQFEALIMTLPIRRIDLLCSYFQSAGLLFYDLYDFRCLRAPIMRFIEYFYSWVYRILPSSSSRIREWRCSA